MAKFFLSASQTFTTRVKPETKRRLEAVAGQLSDVYKVRRNSYNESVAAATTELQNEGIELTETQFHANKQILRNTYLWLEGLSGTKETLYANARKSTLGRFLVDCLTEDGITEWANLNLGAAPTDDGEEAEADEEETPSRPAKIDLAEHDAGAQVLTAFETLTVRLQDMLKENALLRERYTQIEARNVELEEQTAASEAYNGYADEEAARLEEEMRVMRERLRNTEILSLDELADRYPEYPELRSVAFKLKETVNKRAEQIGVLTEHLPKEFVWANDIGEIEYAKSFLNAILALPYADQNRLVEQLKTLATEGAKYTSLHTRKVRGRLPFSPIGCFASRGADDLRFTWTKNGHITVHWVYRKGDRRVGQSEA